jgi:hypothetical protein
MTQRLTEADLEPAFATVSQRRAEALSLALSVLQRESRASRRACRISHSRDLLVARARIRWPMGRRYRGGRPESIKFLFTSLLSGKLAWRLDRHGLRRRPASAGSLGYLRPAAKLAWIPRLSGGMISLYGGNSGSRCRRAPSFNRKSLVANFQYPIFDCRDSVRQH